MAHNTQVSADAHAPLTIEHRVPAHELDAPFLQPTELARVIAVVDHLVATAQRLLGTRYLWGGGSAGASGEAALAGASDASGASGERVLAGASGAPAASGGVLRLRVALLGLAAVGALALAGSIAAP